MCLSFLPEEKLSEDEMDSFFREARLMNSIGVHGNIVELMFYGFLEGKKRAA